MAYAGVRYRQGKPRRQGVGRAGGGAMPRTPSTTGRWATPTTCSRSSTSRSATLAAVRRCRAGRCWSAGRSVQQAKLYNNLGIAAYFAGDWDAALAHYERCRDLGRRAGDLVLEATVANNIGEILSDRGELAAAIELFEAALATFRAPVPVGVALATGNLGRATCAGRPRSRPHLLGERPASSRSIHAASFVAETLVRLAECAIAGEPDECPRPRPAGRAPSAGDAGSVRRGRRGRVRADALLADATAATSPPTRPSAGPGVGASSRPVARRPGRGPPAPSPPPGGRRHCRRHAVRRPRCEPSEPNEMARSGPETARPLRSSPSVRRWRSDRRRRLVRRGLRTSRPTRSRSWRPSAARRVRLARLRMPSDPELDLVRDAFDLRSWPSPTPATSTTAPRSTPRRLPADHRSNHVVLSTTTWRSRFGELFLYAHDYVFTSALPAAAPLARAVHRHLEEDPERLAHGPWRCAADHAAARRKSPTSR